MTDAEQYDGDLRILVNPEKLGFTRAEAFLDINTRGAPSVILEKLGARRKGSGGFNLTIERRYRGGAKQSRGTLCAKSTARAETLETTLELIVAKHSQRSGAEDCLRPPLAMASV